MRLDIEDRVLKKINFRLMMCCVFIITITLMSYIGLMLLDSHMYDKDRVVGVTHDIDHTLPMVYSLKDFSMRNETAKLYEFINNIIYLTEDENVVNYYAVGKTKRGNISLSANLRQASYLALGQAAQVFQTRYQDSASTERRLRAENISWEMLVDCIDIKPWAIGMYKVSVLGEIQVTKTDMAFRRPHETWDYALIEMTIVSGPIWKTEEGDVLNPYGLYVKNYSRKTGLPREIKNSAMRGCNFDNDRDLLRGNL